MKKRDLAILCAIFSVVFLLGGVLLYTVHLYRGKGLSPVASLPEQYDYNGKLLLSRDGESAYLFHPLGREGFEKIQKETLSLSPFGFENETFSYFRVEQVSDIGLQFINFYPTHEGYEGFWPVCVGEKIVYVAEDGKKYRIHPDEGLCYPMFSDSIEGVDPWGVDVIAFSANASYAISLSGPEVTIYHTDPMDDSLRIVDTKQASLASFGENPVFGAFVGNTQCYFTVEAEGKTRFVALDCETGKTAPSLLEKTEEYGPAISRLYTQRLSAAGEEGEFLLGWNHLLLGTSFTSPVLDGFHDGEILAVSPQGTYAVARCRGEREEILVTSEKRAFSVSGVLEEGESVEKVDFIYENILLVSLTREDGTGLSRAYKICF